MLIKTMKDASGLVNAVGEELEAMTKTALSMELSTILHALDAFQSAQSRMKIMNKRTEMEMTFIRLCTPEMDTSPAALLRRIEALERGGLRRPITSVPSVPAAEAPAAPVQQPETPQNNAPVQPAVKDKPQSTEELAKMRSRSTAGRTLSAIWKIIQSRWRRHSRAQRHTSAATTCSSKRRRLRLIS